MTCASCVRRVERALEAVPGVAAATVNLAAESADVTLARPVGPGVLITAVADAGYQAAVPATVRADDVARRRAAQAAELRRRLAADSGYLDALALRQPFDDPRITEDWMRDAHARHLEYVQR